MLTIDVVTLFPEVITPFTSASIPGRAIGAGLVAVRVAKMMGTLDGGGTIRNSEGTLQLTKSPDGNWLLESPVKDRVDSLAISTLFTSLESLRMDVVPAGKVSPSVTFVANCAIATRQQKRRAL